MDMLRRRRNSLLLALLWPLLAGGLTLTACQTVQPFPTAPNRIAIIADGERHTLETEVHTVGAALAAAGIQLGNLDRVQPPENAQLYHGQIITVTRSWQTEEVITATVPFEREVVRNATLPEGESRLLQAGQGGVYEHVYRLTWEEGRLIERALVQEGLTKSPQTEILLVGTRPQVTTTNITGTLAYLEHQEAWILRESSAQRRRLTSFGDLEGRVFTLSPSGRHLLFTRAVTDEQGINALWIAPTTAAVTTPRDTGISNVLWADWSPDGKYIAWSTAERSDRAPGWRGRNDLWTATVTSEGELAHQRRLLEAEAAGGYGWWGTRYCWSPDSEKLAYSRPDEIGIVKWGEPERHPLIKFPSYRTYSSWAWSPDLSWSAESRLLATVLHGPPVTNIDPEESPVFDLWVLEATGAYSTEIASEVGMWATPRFSPDAETLLFGKARVPYQSQLSSYNLCTLDRDGSNQHCFYPPAGEPGIEIPSWRWSPDRRIMAFIYQGDLHLLREGEEIPLPITDEGATTLLDWK
ncbi:MAG: G5 domain-containing protein [Chloroflexota bacterium]|nr:G5 domain-containing protein [Chloroflexota bacterium]